MAIDDLEVVRAECAHADDAEVVVAQHHRVRRAPLVAGEEPRGDEVDIRLERRVEAERPRLEFRQDRNVVRRQRVLARLERVAELSEVDELRDLRLADDELGAVLDGLVFVRELPRERVPRVVGPLDDLEQFALDEIHDAHRVASSLPYQSARSILATAYAVLPPAATASFLNHRAIVVRPAPTRSVDDHVLEPQLRSSESRKRTLGLAPHAQQLDRQRRDRSAGWRGLRPSGAAPRASPPASCRAWTTACRSAAQAAPALRSTGPPQFAQLTEPTFCRSSAICCGRQRADEILLAQEVEEADQTAVAVRAIQVLEARRALHVLRSSQASLAARALGELGVRCAAVCVSFSPMTRNSASVEPGESATLSRASNQNDWQAWQMSMATDRPRWPSKVSSCIDAPQRGHSTSEHCARLTVSEVAARPGSR